MLRKLFATSMLMLGMTHTPSVQADSPTRLAPAISQEEAWKRMPPVTKGQGEPLPVWARSLVTVLPKTAAVMVQVDFAHREKSPLDAKLRAAMRWVAAHQNQSDYAKAEAVADAKRAGLDELAFKELASGDESRWTAAEKNALQFARKMTVNSSSVTDEEFAALVKEFGEKKASAMVLLMAWSNFQDRLLRCLGVGSEETPVTPLDLVLKAETATTKTTPPTPKQPKPLPAPTGTGKIEDPDSWKTLSYEILQNKLESQRKRTTRVSIPKWEDVEKGLPPGLFAKPSTIVWNQVCLGHVPELAVPWEIFMRTGGSESGSKWDRIFAIGVFWVTTKAVNCPYCMGHCEMNWEVAGLTQSDIAERSKVLSGDDWSSFPAEQQRAFALARKLSVKPPSVTAQDLETLRKDFGPEAALVVALSASRYHYMTRISNGFQLTLERDNVFYDYWNVPKPSKESAEVEKKK